MIEESGHAKAVHWLRKDVGVHVEIRNNKASYVPAVCIKHQKLERDYLSATVVHPLFVRYQKLKHPRPGIKPWALRPSRNRQLCIDVRSGAQRQGIHCAFCEARTSFKTPLSDNDVIDECSLCCMSFHPRCSAALESHLSTSGGSGSSSAASSSGAPPPPAGEIADLKLPAGFEPPANLSEAAWTTSVCHACRFLVQ